MVLAYLGHRVIYEHLRQRLGTTTTGTPFSRLGRLRSFQLIVELGRGDMRTPRKHLMAGRPVIVAVPTELLPYWLMRAECWTRKLNQYLPSRRAVNAGQPQPLPSGATSPIA
jgi:hypothetical protein